MSQAPDKHKNLISNDDDKLNKIVENSDEQKSPIKVGGISCDSLSINSSQDESFSPFKNIDVLIALQKTG